MARNKKRQEKEEKGYRKPKLNLSKETKRAIAVVIFVALALLVLLSLVGIAGDWGNYMFKFLSAIFGVLTYAVPLILLMVAIALYKQNLEDDAEKQFYLRTYVGAILLTGSVAGLIHMFQISPELGAFDLAAQGRGGGYLGAIFSAPAYNLFGFWAGSIILFALFLIGVLITFDISLKKLFMSRPAAEPLKESEPALPLKINAMNQEGFVSEKVTDKNKMIQEPAEETIVKTTPLKTGVVQQKSDPLALEAITLEDRKDWKLPPFDLLDDNQTRWTAAT